MDNKNCNFWIIPGLDNEHSYISDLDFATRIINKTKKIFGLDIFEKTRKRQYADLRMITAHIIKKHTKLSLCEIGKMLGKDHATILHYNKTAEFLLKTNEQFKSKYRIMTNENQITIADAITDQNTKK